MESMVLFQWVNGKKSQYTISLRQNDEPSDGGWGIMFNLNRQFKNGS